LKSFHFIFELSHSRKNVLTRWFVWNLGVNGIEEKDTAKAITKVKALAPIAQELGVTQAQLAIAWVHQHSTNSAHHHTPKHKHKNTKTKSQSQSQSHKYTITLRKIFLLMMLWVCDTFW
jgi:diketogulonate reductase-like aldo/keto reductase